MKISVNSRRKAFTLIELLVVIAIISILAAILFPVFASAREKARQTSCMSNLNQLGLAFQQYTQDYDEYYPCGTFVPTGVASSTLGLGWAGQIYSYVKSPGAYVCPDDNSKAPVAGEYPLSYAMNCNIPRSASGSGTSYGIGGASAALNATSVTVLLVEVSGESANMTNPAEGAGTTAADYSVVTEGIPDVWNAGSSNTTGKLATGYLGGATVQTSFWFKTTLYVQSQGRHSGGANYLLCDGHVKWYRPDVVCPGLNAPTPTSTFGAWNAWSACGTTALSTSTPSYAITFSAI